MFIKSVEIEGFKSYKEKTSITLSQGVNVLVGPNGSGKSNFLAALRFVLCVDEFSKTLDERTRKSLLNTGSGTHSTLASVTVVFDNSDGRFEGQTTNDVEITRTISAVKDTILLNDKITQISQLKRMFETCGYSSQNPYYVVQQGQIARLTKATPEDRLHLIKTIAGATLFDEKIAEGQKKLSENNLRFEKIDDALAVIRRRCAELNEERRELLEFQQLDLEKKCYQHVLASRELQDAERKLALHNSKIEASRRELAAQNEQYEEIQARGIELTNRLEKLEDEEAALGEDHQRVLSERKACVADMAELDNLKESLTQSLHSTLDKTNALEVSLQAIEASIAQANEQLSQVAETIASASAELAARQREKDAVELELESLKSSYTSKEQRDNDLGRQRAEALATSSELEKLLLELEEKKLLFEREKKIQDDIVTEQSSTIAELESTHEAQSTMTKELKLQFENALDQKRASARNSAKLRERLTDLNNLHDAAKRQLESFMRRDFRKGTQTVKELVSNLGLEDSVYGIVGEVIEVDAVYQSAVERVAGHTMFDFIVKDEIVAKEILQHMSNLPNAGRATLMPLNQMMLSNKDYPQTDDCFPLIQKIKCDVKLKPALQQILGNVLVVQSLELAPTYSNQGKFKCVTLDGDVYEASGLISGGYNDNFRKRMLHSIKEKADIEHLLAEAEKSKKETDEELASLESLITKTAHKVSIAESNLNEQHRKLGGHRRRLEIAYNERSEYHKNIRQVEEQIKSVREQIEQLTNFVSLLNTQLAKSFDNETSDKQRERSGKLAERLADLHQEIAIENEKLDAAKTHSSALYQEILMNEGQMTAFTTEINENKLEARTLQQQLSESESRYLRLKSHFDGLESSPEIARGQEIIAEIEATRESLMELLREQEVLDAKIVKLNEIIKSEEPSIQHFEKEKQEHKEKIIRLGILPEKAYNNRESLSTVKRKLQQLDKQIKENYPYVTNMRADEQYTKALADEQALEARRQELGDGDNAINMLIENLVARKSDVLSKTFKQVSDLFEKIFTRIFPNGQGRLKMLVGDDGNNKVRRGQQKRQQSDQVESYVGVDFELSFSSKLNDRQGVNQYSGGQQALCALALIFALQQSDPVGTYIFDEVDANLDSEYKSCIAELINGLSNGESFTGSLNQVDCRKQFICTTFGAEMLEESDRCFRVDQHLRQSSITQVSQDEAIEFVKERRVQ